MSQNNKLDRSALQQAVSNCLAKDTFRLNRDLQTIFGLIKQNKPFDNKLAKLLLSIERSQQVLAQRKTVLKLNYPESLPVSQKREQILAALSEHQVIIIAGETGSGKTTQLPKMCLELGLGQAGTIAHTQPRRLAARSVASRIAQELEVEMGQEVGCQVRFSDQTTDRTRVKLMTDGILLAQTQNDKFLSEYDCIIIDEAHERSLNIDFLLGFLKQLLPKRPDLKVVITSATIDLTRFSEHFSNAPVIEVSGRTFPVEDRFRPLVREHEDDTDLTIQEGILHGLQELAAQDRIKQQAGDVLVFLPGEREIRECAEFLRKMTLHDKDLRNSQILPLYARLGVSEQGKIFTESVGRRIILATNVAETSLTVPGIRYVIDSGVARISRYSYRSKVQRLPVEAISQASANQRRGRCGRVADGICIRLYSEDDFLSRPAFTEPEIQRTNLAAVILQMISLKLGSISDFPFVDAPDPRFIKDGFNLLQELEAVTSSKAEGQFVLTPLGRQMSRLPVEPRISRMLLQAKKQNALREVLIIASALSIQDPRERPADKKQAADQKHKELAHEESDFLSFVNLWDAFEEQRQELTNSQLRKWCQKNFVNYMRMREWRDVHKQLHILCREMDFVLNTESASYENVHKSLLAGLLSHIAQKEDGAEYLGARQRKLQIFPASGLYKKRPKWIVAAELMETTRLYARIVAKIDPQWLEQLAKPLLRKSYFEPHWSKKRGQVIAYEQTSLYGLIINPKRAIDFSRINMSEARNLFIQQGLVENNIELKSKFYQHNIELIAELAELEEKTRTRSYVVEDAVVGHFYDENIPTDVATVISLYAWLKKPATNEKALYLSKEYLLKQSEDSVTDDLYPSYFNYQGISFPLAYAFSPGAKDDGVSMTVPASVLGQISIDQADWLVPGFIKDKCIAIFKGLAKPIRKQLVPVPNTVDDFLHIANVNEGGLFPQLVNFLYAKYRIKIDLDDLRAINLDDHFKMNYQVVDNDKVVGQGRDLTLLKAEFEGLGQAQATVLTDKEFDRSNITQWDFSTLPQVTERDLQGLKVRMFPMLIDQGGHVDMTLHADQDFAEISSRQGVIRLLRLSLALQDKDLRKELRLLDPVMPYAQGLAAKQVFYNDILDACYNLCLLSADELPRTEQAFKACLDKRAELYPTLVKIIDWLKRVLPLRHKILKQMKGNTTIDRAYAYSDVKSQLNELFQENFIIQTPWVYLKSYTRYLEGILYRLDKLQGQLQRDRLRIAEVDELRQLHQAGIKQLSIPYYANADLLDFYWLLQELRMSLFAQPLGTSEPVSNKRLRQRWNEIKIKLSL
ncbi:MAG: ATP-dependent helicase HrpA [Oleispira sp.]